MKTELFLNCGQERESKRASERVLGFLTQRILDRSLFCTNLLSVVLVVEKAAPVDPELSQWRRSVFKPEGEANISPFAEFLGEVVTPLHWIRCVDPETLFWLPEFSGK